MTEWEIIPNTLFKKVLFYLFAGLMAGLGVSTAIGAVYMFYRAAVSIPHPDTGLYVLAGVAFAFCTGVVWSVAVYIAHDAWSARRKVYRRGEK